MTTKKIVIHTYVFCTLFLIYNLEHFVGLICLSVLKKLKILFTYPLECDFLKKFYKEFWWNTEPRFKRKNQAICFNGLRLQISIKFEVRKYALIKYCCNILQE